MRSRSPIKPVLVVGLNPAIDAEWRVPAIRWDEKNNLQAERRWAGGKPPNVARWLRHLDHPATLLLPLGGEPGRELREDLERQGVPLRVVPIRQATRVNVMVTQDRGPQLRFNPLGPKLNRTEWDAVFHAVRKAFRTHGVLICSGSLPRGAAVGTHRRLIAEANAAGLLTILDCDGPALRAGLPARPFLVKPNEFELAQWAGRRLTTEAAIRRAALQMSGATGGWVYVSRDARGGMLLNARLGFARAAAVPKVRVRNTVGAGDATLAQIAAALAGDLPPEMWLKLGLAAGTASVQVSAGQLPPKSLLRAMRRALSR